MFLSFCFSRTAFCVLYNKPGSVLTLVFFPGRTAGLGFVLERLTEE
jgi:hypothetical protein